MGRSIVGKPESEGSYDENSLTNKEKQVLLCLMRNLDGTVSRLSEFCGIPYPTFISIKKRLRSKNAYYKLNLPSIWDLGGDIISFDLVFSP